MERETRREILGGNLGIWETVERMRHFITMGGTALRGLPVATYPKTDAGIEAAFYWVRGHLHYQEHPPSEQIVHSPLVLIARMERASDGRAVGDCVDYTVLLGSILAAMRVPLKIVVQSKRPDGVHEHVYLHAMMEGGWTPLDPSGTSALGWEDPDVTSREEVRV